MNMKPIVSSQTTSKFYYYIHTLYSFIIRGGAVVYPMRIVHIVHHICVVDKPRNIRYIKWKSGQEVLDILGIHLAEDIFSQLNSTVRLV